ncbi:MAG TPA: type II toxin-antitoxin system HigB family toxin [Puia sp.]|nr:type II toxin-antitoxin system HigB family toxin [Puia sp.]
MKVRLIKTRTIFKYAVINVKSRSSFRIWLSNLKYADWTLPEDIRCLFSSADLLRNGSNRVVFDIGGNNYRMICKYWFGATRVHLYVKWIGTHAEYEKICDKNLQYTVNDY